MTGRERAEAWWAPGRRGAAKRAAERAARNRNPRACPAALIPAQRDRVTAVDDRGA